MTKYYDRFSGRVESISLREYYKYRKFVPFSPDVRLGKMLNSYHYKRLKLYYNQIKRNLNLTPDPSSLSGFTNSDSSTLSKNIFQSKILQ